VNVAVVRSRSAAWKAAPHRDADDLLAVEEPSRFDWEIAASPSPCELPETISNWPRAFCIPKG
jgi:hypothetical protein